MSFFKNERLVLLEERELNGIFSLKITFQVPEFLMYFLALLLDKRFITVIYWMF